MASMAKKVVICAMVGIMQIGVGASLVSAAPHHSVHITNNYYSHGNDRQREYDKRLQEENARHERAMQRRWDESESAWYARQQQENERHDESLHQIEAFLLGAIVGSIIN